MSCKFENGDGTGGSEKKIGMQTGEECIQACITYKKTKDDRVNGVTILQVGSLLFILGRKDIILTVVLTNVFPVYAILGQHINKCATS